METVEELEPLFDYTRVQPLDLLYFDDDDDCSSIVPSKFRKPSVSVAVEKVQVTGEEIGIDDGDDDDDLDWLAPPKVAKKGKQCENLDIKELRYSYYIRFCLLYGVDD
ncbi:hypothetical protein Hanom_Chr05g00398631 [Helianthus anomalus]